MSGQCRSTLILIAKITQLENWRHLEEDLRDQDQDPIV
jgi:hypothetical protein